MWKILLFPVFVGALAITAFANGLWMSIGGFLVPLPVLNVFWKYAFHYWDYQTYVFQGMMVNEFKDRTYQCNSLDVQGNCHCMYDSSEAKQCQIPGRAARDNLSRSLRQCQSGSGVSRRAGGRDGHGRVLHDSGGRHVSSVQGALVPAVQAPVALACLLLADQQTSPNGRLRLLLRGPWCRWRALQRPAWA